MCNSKIYVVQSPPKLGVNLFPGVKAYIQNMSRLTKVEYVRVHLLKNNPRLPLAVISVKSINLIFKVWDVLGQCAANLFGKYFETKQFRFLLLKRTWQCVAVENETKCEERDIA